MLSIHTYTGICKVSCMINLFIQNIPTRRHNTRSSLAKSNKHDMAGIDISTNCISYTCPETSPDITTGCLRYTDEGRELAEELQPPPKRPFPVQKVLAHWSNTNQQRMAMKALLKVFVDTRLSLAFRTTQTPSNMTWMCVCKGVCICDNCTNFTLFFFCLISRFSLPFPIPIYEGASPRICGAWTFTFPINTPSNDHALVK